MIGLKPALIVIDMNKDFVYGKLGNERAKKLVPRLKELIERARESSIPVIYVGDAHLPSDPEIRIWGEHSMKGTTGAEIVDELKPREGDYILEKRAYSAFHETGLDMLLRSLGIDTVILTGLHTNICVRHTAADAFFKGYRIIVPRDAVDAFTEKEHVEGLEYLKRVYGAEILDSSELMGKLVKK
ncbi:MAG: isochorismatase family cysteine hydrolase [Sulfolobales archaeon]